MKELKKATIVLGFVLFGLQVLNAWADFKRRY